MDNEGRRSMLRSITDEQYDDIMNVLSIYPHVTMDVSCEVFDDEEVHKITTGAVVTLTVHLQRENMSTVFSKELGTNVVDNENHDDQREDKENQEKVRRLFRSMGEMNCRDDFEKTNETSKGAAANTSKGWNNKSDKKKKTKKKGPPPSNKSANTSTTKPSTTPVVNKSQTKDSSGLYFNLYF